MDEDMRLAVRACRACSIHIRPPTYEAHRKLPILPIREIAQRFVVGAPSRPPSAVGFVVLEALPPSTRARVTVTVRILFPHF